MVFLEVPDESSSVLKCFLLTYTASESWRNGFLTANEMTFHTIDCGTLVTTILEGERERGREGGREERGRERGEREGVRERGREGGSEGGREGEREGVRE